MRDVKKETPTVGHAFEAPTADLFNSLLVLFNKYTYMKPLILLLCVVLLAPLASCKKGSKGERTLLQNVTGSAGEVVLVLNREVWEESVGKTFNEILKAEYPMIPQSEPLFDLIRIPSKSFSDIFRTHRNIILVKVSDEFKDARIIPQRDVWAAPQTVLNIVGPTYPAIERMLREESERLVHLLEQAERDRSIQNAIRFEVKPLRDLLESKFGVTLYFPKGYQLNLDTTNFVWITFETARVSQGILVYEFPYQDANTFTADYLVKQRNHFVSRFVLGPVDSTHMVTTGIIPPRFTPLMYNNRYFGQLRGLWEVQGHPMGGPFISLATVDEANARVVVVEGFVFAPGLPKRNYLRNVEALLYTFELKPGKVEP